MAQKNVGLICGSKIDWVQKISGTNSFWTKKNGVKNMLVQKSIESTELLTLN